ncbi:2-amino-4-hydroxy-6-hydroxymethyldihydropteridinediphosphokinase [soil metagenome]
MKELVQAFVGIGANQGDLRATLASAVEAIQAIPQTSLVQRSSLYLTAPQDATGADYLNAVVELRTQLAPRELLEALFRIEDAHGRDRPYRNAPRTLDLDLLLFGDTQLQTPVLTVPHPRLHERAFVLRPLAEIAPALLIPGRGEVCMLMTHVADQRVDKLAA